MKNIDDNIEKSVKNEQVYQETDKKFGKNNAGTGNENLNDIAKSVIDDLFQIQNFDEIGEDFGKNVTIGFDSKFKTSSNLENNLKESETLSPKIQNLKTHKNKTLPKNLLKENIHKDHRQRLKNQFLNNGIGGLTDVQKLELLLFYAIPQRDTNPLSHKLIKEFGSLKNVFQADIKSLCKVSGIKENSAILINLVGKLYSSINLPEENEKLGSTTLAKEFCKKLFIGAEVEEFYVICLTKSNQVKKYKLIQTGTADEINVQIRAITEFAIASKCNRIIITHNHPGGIGAVSDDDYKFTYALICSCLLNTIEVIDHIIVGVDTTISMHSQGSLSSLKHKAYDRLQIPITKVNFLSSLSENYEID